MSGRQPTSYKVTTRGGIGSRAGQAPVNHFQDVHVVNRPVTNHGLTGMKTSNLGPGRGVFNKSYYMGLITQKNTELHDEIERFQTEMEEINRDTNLFKTLEKQKEQLIKEVRNLQGELADYNLTLDKMRASTQVDQVMSTYEYIRLQNMRQREEVDKFFLERKQMQQEIAKIEMQIQNMNTQAQERLGELDPEHRHEYFQLQHQNRQLEDEINQKKQMMETVNERLAMADSKLRTDVIKQKANHLREQKQNLQRRKEDLQVQTNEQNLSFPQAREQLLARVKKDNQVIKESEERIREIEKAIMNYKKQIEEIQHELKTNDSSHVDKIGVLEQRDAEMSKFIQSFEPTKKAQLEMIQNLEQNIANLLGTIAKNLDRRQNLPTQNQVEDLKEDFKFKKQQAISSHVTMERLNKELEDRKQEILNFQKLDERLPTQISNIKDKIEEMEQDLNTKYKNIDQFKIEAQNELERLQRLRVSLGKKKETMAIHLKSISHRFDTKKQLLRDNSINKEIESDEQKMTMNEQTIHSLKSYIDNKGAETNYQPLQGDCREFLRDINNMLVSKYR